jgi:hypothetical protein
MGEVLEWDYENFTSKSSNVWYCSTLILKTEKRKERS